MTHPLLDLELNELLERNRGLKDRHLGERCFILATGPSIKKQNLKLLQGETCFALSNFFVHPDYWFINPRYYSIAPFHYPPFTEEVWHSWMREVSAGTRNATMFFGLTDRERNLKNGLFENRESYFVRLQDGLVIQHCDLTRPIPAPWTAPIMVLPIAIYMGFREIYLLGCDHDWILHLHESTHFYEESQHACVRGGTDMWVDSQKSGYMEGQCRHLILLWQQYRMLQAVAHSKGIQIINATTGGILDVLPRVKFESLFDASRLALYPTSSSRERVDVQPSIPTKSKSSEMFFMDDSL